MVVTENRASRHVIVVQMLRADARGEKKKIDQFLRTKNHSTCVVKLSIAIWFAKKSRPRCRISALTLSHHQILVFVEQTLSFYAR